MKETVLGLDIGTNSIGWALINKSEARILDCGVRVFPAGVDNFDTGKEKSRNAERREARMARRVTARRRRRRKILKDSLVQAGLFPEEPSGQAKLYAICPYALRKKALDEKLTPHELGRVFLNLSQHRGFLSTRKGERKDKEVQGMLAEISELSGEMQAAGARTLGEYHADILARDDHAQVRNVHTHRQMYEDEFEQIWKAQKQFHNNLLNKELKYGRVGPQDFPAKPEPLLPDESRLQAFGIHGLIFFQRKMFWPKESVGKCELEPNEYRIRLSDRRAQIFRILQDVNNLRLIDTINHRERTLSAEERPKIIEALTRKKEMQFGQIRKLLSLDESSKFNLEKGERAKLKGNTTDAILAGKKYFGRKWHDLPEEDKNTIVEKLLDDEMNPEELISEAISKWGLGAEQAEELAELTLPPGYGNLSLKAIEKLLPPLQLGLPYMANNIEDSAIHAAGYLRSDERKRAVYAKLPALSEAGAAGVEQPLNPVVIRSLVETRKLVNAVIHEYGKPDAIHVEMIRSLKMGRKKRQEYNKTIRQREKEREDAKTRLEEHGIDPTREAITRYLLWEEQERRCIYTGEPISISQLLRGEADVDHIFPRHRSLDDSYMNKVVCFRAANQEKQDRTPYEWLGQNEDKRYEGLLDRVGKLLKKHKLPYSKYRRFVQKELDLDQFVNRQLTDTAYIARSALAFLKLLYPKQQEHKVMGLKGQLTAELRWQWGLHSVLGDDITRKNRDDHRHHAVDAIIIALTDRETLHALSRALKFRHDRNRLPLREPWDCFRNEVKLKVESIVVSHRTERRISGRLHEDTIYGAVSDGKDKPDGVYVIRKPVDALTAAEIPMIRDDAIKKAVVNRLEQHGIGFGRGKKEEKKEISKILSDPENPLVMRSGNPIKRVRVLKKEDSVVPLREGFDNTVYVKPGNTHHVSIFERVSDDGKVKRIAYFTTMMEATKRLKNHEEVITKEHPDYPAAKFVMSLSWGEMVKDIKGRHLVFLSGPMTTQQMTFVDHRDARPGKQRKKITFYPNSLCAEKIQVDYIGRVRWAND